MNCMIKVKLLLQKKILKGEDGRKLKLEKTKDENTKLNKGTKIYGGRLVEIKYRIEYIEKDIRLNDISVTSECMCIN